MPILVTMFLSGLWHGAGFQFLLFGVLHGAALVINHAWRLARPRIWPDTAHYQRATRPFAWALTFLLVVRGDDVVPCRLGGGRRRHRHRHVRAARSCMPEAIVTGRPVLAPGLAEILGRAVMSFAGDNGNELGSACGWIVVLMAIALVPPNTLEILRAWQPAITLPAVEAYGPARLVARPGGARPTYRCLRSGPWRRPLSGGWRRWA